MFANPPHKLDRTILGFENSSSGIGDRDRELEAVIGLIPDFAISIELKPNPLALNQLFQSHRIPD
jgi:hypothetical protein